MIRIEPGHPDAQDPRLLALARALEARGATVLVDAGGENLLRMEGEGESRRAVVECQGIGNLAHELVHVIRVDRLDDDHGIEYGSIPFDPGDPEGFRVLLDELAACTISCAYDPRDRDAWFAEQIEIQPVFYGHEDDPERFWARIDALVRERGGEIEAVVAATFERVEVELEAAGAPPGVARVRPRESFAALWRRYRERGSGAIPAGGEG